jgi:predicted O-linked N-acetylglucosamine transferase (SPINDLY family)
VTTKFDEAVRHLQAGNFAKAEKLLLKSVSASPRDFDATHMLAVVSVELGKAKDAEKYFRLAHAINPKYPPLYQNWGLLLGRQNRFQEAVDKFTQAIELAPNYPPFYSDRGNALSALKRLDEAVSDHDQAIKLAPNFYGFYHNRGNARAEHAQYEAALADYGRAIQLNPNYAAAFSGRGNVLLDLERYDEALAAFDKALSVTPDLAEAWLGRGTVFHHRKRYDEAFAAFDKAFSIKPDLETVEGARLHAKMSLCNWLNLDKEIGRLVASIRSKKASSPPLALLSLTDSPADHFHCAEARFAAKHSIAVVSSRQNEVYKHDKIRVGYVSTDFRVHPVGYLTAGLFAAHDRDRFETYAFSIGPNDRSDLRDRLEKSFSGFFDFSASGDSDVIDAIKSSEIDILVDLNGHTEGARTPIFVDRPAPVIVNFLGYAGSMGTDVYDYAVVDRCVAPAANRQFFSEKLVYLPHCFMPHDEVGRKISDLPQDRAEHELPKDGFVFCCFNNAYKLNPRVFRSWMTILDGVNGSVLWLSDMHATARQNLREEAKRRGIDPDRLVFAKRVPSPSEHLARHRLADLFLDTLPYNAHTTASDALWAGLPVLTQIGNSFAGRVAASLLTAIDLPELITQSVADYEALAIGLALDPGKLKAIRDKLAGKRLTTPLFDTPSYTKHFEAAYQAMYQRHQAGLPPDDIEIAAIR